MNLTPRLAAPVDETADQDDRHHHLNNQQCLSVISGERSSQAKPATRAGQHSIARDRRRASFNRMDRSPGAARHSNQMFNCASAAVELRAAERLCGQREQVILTAGVWRKIMHSEEFDLCAKPTARKRIVNKRGQWSIQ